MLVDVFKTRHMNQITSNFWKRLAAAFLIACSIALSGCAIAPSGAFLHSFHHCNMGTKSLTYLKIIYGEVRPTEVNYRKPYPGGDSNCINRSGTTAHMPIPEHMYVEWQTEDGQRHSATIPIRSLVTQKHPVRSFQVRINDEGLQIYQTNLTPPVRDYTLIFEK